MTVTEIAQACFNSIAWRAKNFPETADQAAVSLVVPREARGVRVRLAGPGSPLGEVLNVQDGKTVAAFQCKDVLKWLARNGVQFVLEGDDAG